MTTYNHEYFFIESEKDNEQLPSLVPAIGTRDRQFRYERQAPAAPPLTFFNGWKGENAISGIRDIAADILFDGADFMIKAHLAMRLCEHTVPHLYLHPAVYIDDSDVPRKDYFYLTFTKSFDCWDREASRFEPDPLVIGQSVRYAMYSYSLNTALLDQTPMENRLLFRMGGTTDGMVVCHESIADIFRGKASGATLTAVSRW
jgi:hypothetical protein